MKAIIVLTVALSACLALTALCEEAITLSGRRVILNDDGTWKYKEVEEPNEITFRGVPWGCSPGEIKKIIKQVPAFDQNDFVVYNETLDGLHCQCIFIILKGQFVRGRYLFKEDHYNENLYISDFDRIGSLLAGKYGYPSDHDEVWLGDRPRPAHKRRGMDVALGRLRICTKWKMSKASIVHWLSGDNYNVHHIIEYTHEDMSEIEALLQNEEDNAKL